MPTTYETLQTIVANAINSVEALIAASNESPQVAYNSVIRQLRHQMHQSIEAAGDRRHARNSRHYPVRILIAHAAPGSEFGPWEYEASSAAPGVAADDFSRSDSPYYGAVFGAQIPPLTVCPLTSIGQFVAEQLGNYHHPNAPQTLALADKLQRSLPSLRVQLSDKGYVRRVIEYPVADPDGNVTEYRAEIEVWAPASAA